MTGPLLGIIAFLLALLASLLATSLTLRRLGAVAAPRRWPRVSVLLPVRNEERTIERCVRSLLAQDYADYGDFEIIVLDDDSTDETGAILERMAGESERLRAVAGSPLPEGWLGKHWACDQLAAMADGEVLYFTDADTYHTPDALRATIATLEATEADLVTGLTRQELGGWMERLVVPILPWSVLTFVPLPLAHWLRLPVLSVTIGQLMAFRRDAYAAVGGHGAVRLHAVDDIALGRLIKAAGLRWRLADATRHVSCRMYRSAPAVVEGFGKNLFAAFDYHLAPFAFVWTWLLLVALVPWLALAAAVAGLAPDAATGPLALVAIALMMLQMALAFARARLPIWLALLAPLAMTVTVWVALRSAMLAARGTAVWKGRVLPSRSQLP